MKPILFSGEMVRAILDGRKTQTRRVVKPQPTEHVTGGTYNWKGSLPFVNLPIDAILDSCPYGQPGDQIWVRETFNYHGTTRGPRVTYRSDGTEQFFKDAPDGPWWLADDNDWRPSIFMPRWASRITLEITGVRVERVQDISPDDCRAEGEPGKNNDIGVRYGFGQLWNRINEKRGFGWDVNPWCWCISFKRV